MPRMGWCYPLWRCAVLKDLGGVVSRLFPVALARGKHLFPFRTEQLSPSAPMVLGSQGPGRVGRRRFFHTRAAFGRPVVVLGGIGAVGSPVIPPPAEFSAGVTPSLAEKPGAAAVPRLHARILRASRGKLAGRILGVEADERVLRALGPRSR